MIHIQFLKFALIGIFSNLVVFILYLSLTSWGIYHLQAMSFTYVLGVGLGFILNRAWTFAHKGRWSPALLRYLMAYSLGYVFNLVTLYFLVNVMGFSHEPVQGTLILVTAIFLFILQRVWVFNT